MLPQTGKSAHCAAIEGFAGPLTVGQLDPSAQNPQSQVSMIEWFSHYFK